MDIICYCGHDSNITPWFKQCWHISVNQQLNPPRPIRINSNVVCIIVQSKTVAIKPDTTWSRSDRNIYSHHQSFHPFTFTPAHAPYEQQNIIISNEIFISCMHQMHKTVQEKQTRILVQSQFAHMHMGCKQSKKPQNCRYVYRMPMTSLNLFYARFIVPTWLELMDLIWAESLFDDTNWPSCIFIRHSGRMFSLGFWD